MPSLPPGRARAAQPGGGCRDGQLSGLRSHPVWPGPGVRPSRWFNSAHDPVKNHAGAPPAAGALKTTQARSPASRRSDSRESLAEEVRAPTGLPRIPLLTKTVLFIAFAFAIMADPVSSVAYTIEASLRALHGYLGLLMATQIIVLGIILLVDVNYWQLVGRFPMGGDRRRALPGRSEPDGPSSRSVR
jgi:hypothetical protein